MYITLKITDILRKLKFLLPLLIFTNVLGQNISDFQKSYLPIWESAKVHTLEIARTMPDSLYSYKPTDELRTFSQQMVHMGHSILWMYERIILKKKDDFTKSPDANKMSKREIINYLIYCYDRGESHIKALKKKDLNKTVSYFEKGAITAQYAMYSILDHQTNHRSKSNLYLRLCGIKPPIYSYL